ncbi:hypothetical protein [Actinomycetospora chibensis]|uniref:Uncharacterized protein n=1 Tax=Actinomycetospora chibensis TaxID=663606 RepID=A0ABV9RB49_9PSEU|nr:hypothetical protein [Actinomycetospora chibensis]MDD7925529.1 hypothetical protein [Actinomycetospora chibensis]
MAPDDGPSSDAGVLLVGVSLGVSLVVSLGGWVVAWVVGWVVGSLLAGGWDGEEDGEPVPVEVDGAPLPVEVPDVGRPPPPSPPRTTDDGPAGAPTAGRGADAPGPGAAGCARGCCSERRARSATVGVIVGEEVTDPTGAAPGVPHGRGVSSSVTAPGIATVVEDWLIVW